MKMLFLPLNRMSSNVIDQNIFGYDYIFYDILTDTCFILTQGCLEFQDSILQKQKKNKKGQ